MEHKHKPHYNKLQHFDSIIAKKILAKLLDRPLSSGSKFKVQIAVFPNSEQDGFQVGHGFFAGNLAQGSSQMSCLLPNKGF